MDEQPNEATPRHPRWADVPRERWEDWKWQMANRVHDLHELEQIIRLTLQERRAIQASGLFRIDVTPYFASLIDPDDPFCPVRMQVIPREQELEAFEGADPDSTSEELREPVRGIVHKYPDRLIMLLTSECASYCRYCTRSRFVGEQSKTYTSLDHERQLEYVRSNPRIRDVLLTGGDPLVLAHRRIAQLLAELRKIPHVEILRLGTRAPVFNPFCVTDEFCSMLEQNHPVWVNIHTNHPKELTPELRRACAKLLKAGVPIGNQSVLLAGINDSVEIQRKLCTELVRMRVRPYYLYQCDSVKGAGHFRTSVARGIEIMEGLRGHITGFAVPTYIIDSPDGGGKIPVQPNYLLSMSPDRVVLRNYRGDITVYDAPVDYQPPRPAIPPAPAHEKPTVSDLLRSRPRPEAAPAHELTVLETRPHRSPPPGNGALPAVEDRLADAAAGSLQEL